MTKTRITLKSAQEATPGLRATQPKMRRKLQILDWPLGPSSKSESISIYLYLHLLLSLKAARAARFSSSATFALDHFRNLPSWLIRPLDNRNRNPPRLTGLGQRLRPINLPLAGNLVVLISAQEAIILDVVSVTTSEMRMYGQTWSEWMQANIN